MRTVALELLADVAGADGPGLLVGLLGPTGAVAVQPLPDAPGLEALLGVEAPAGWWAYGVVAPARTHPPDAPHECTPGWFAHLVERAGTSVSVLWPDDGAPATSCTDQPAPGRLADLCRRTLRLPTAPPPADMVAYVVDVWLGLVVRRAVGHPGTRWEDVVGLNPATEADPDLRDDAASATPAAVAAGTRRFGTELDWETFRLACVAEGGTPFGELDADDASWLDAGAFARWLLGESPAWPEVLDILDGVLPPATADRLWATLALCSSPAGSASR